MTLDGSGSSDPEGHAITYAWTQVDDLGDPVTTGPSKVTLVERHGAEADVRGPGTVRRRCTSSWSSPTRSALASPADTVDIAVDANGTPTANAGPDQSGSRPARR